MQNKRKNELSITSVVLMLLVMLIHLLSEAVTGYAVNTVAYALTNIVQRLASFVVQGFIFLSGLKLFISEREKSTLKFYLGRLRRVVLPYVIAFSLSYCFLFAIGLVPLSASYFVRELLSGGMVGHFYFVPAICGFYLLFPLWRLIYRKASPVLALIISLFAMLLMSQYLPEILKLSFGVDFKYNARLFPTYIFYFVAGLLAGKYYGAFAAMLQAHRASIIATAVFFGAADCTLYLLILRGEYYPPYAETVHIGYCIFAILVTLSLALAVSKTKAAEHGLIGLVDRASYNVYLIHPMFIFASAAVLTELGVKNLIVRFLLSAAVVYIVCIGACVLFELLMLKIKKNQT